MASTFNLERLSYFFTAHWAATLSALGAAVIVPIIISDYRLYISYGPNGLPNNLKGWLITSALRLLAREQRSSSLYNDKTLPFANEPGFLAADFPPQRRSSRPTMGPHPAPHRQLDQLPDKAAREKLIARFEELGQHAQAKGLIDLRQSLFEKQHTAMFVAKARPWHSIAQQTRGETAHIHAGIDGSVHVVLHPADCKSVLEAGWGERQALDGVKLLKKLVGASLPVNYILLYAPRDDAELETVLSIVKASIRFMAGARDALG